MKLKSLLLLFALAAALPTQAQLNIPGADGSDGIFPPPNAGNSIVVDLSLAVPATWDTPGNGDGVYDADKWVIVFKYSAINIPAGVTVTFKNHPSRAPVVWLVKNDAVINGVVDVGSQRMTGPEGLLWEPGPGGFRGGPIRGTGIESSSIGLGPGGGSIGAYGQPNTGYGNARIVPLIGGSGASGREGGGEPGQSGGGAILIAVKGTLSLNGTLISQPTHTAGTFSGSGGAIRIISNRLLGTGQIDVRGDLKRDVYGFARGRVRVETQFNESVIVTYPTTLIVPPDNPPTIFPDNQPTARIVSIGGFDAPSDPRSHLAQPGGDLLLQSDKDVDIMIETRYMPTNSIVRALVRGIYLEQGIDKAAKFVSGDESRSLWRASTVIPYGFSAVQVRAVGP